MYIVYEIFFECTIFYVISLFEIMFYFKILFWKYLYLYLYFFIWNTILMVFGPTLVRCLLCRRPCAHALIMIIICEFDGLSCAQIFLCALWWRRERKCYMGAHVATIHSKEYARWLLWAIIIIELWHIYSVCCE